MACASSDGKVSVLEFKEDGSWDTKLFQAHAIGCNAVAWAPAASPGSIVQTSGGAPNATGSRRFVTGGSDNLVKIWSWKYALPCSSPVKIELTFDHPCLVLRLVNILKRLRWKGIPTGYEVVLCSLLRSHITLLIREFL